MMGIMADMGLTSHGYRTPLLLLETVIIGIELVSTSNADGVRYA